MAADPSPTRSPQRQRSDSPMRQMISSPMRSPLRREDESRISPQRRENESRMSPQRQKSQSPQRPTIDAAAPGSSRTDNETTGQIEPDAIHAPLTGDGGHVTLATDEQSDLQKDDSAMPEEDKAPSAAASESDNGSNLFGDSDNDETGLDKSGEDEGMQEEAPVAAVTHRTISDLTIPAHQKFKLAKLPKFLRFEQSAFHPDTFVPEEADTPDSAGLSVAQQRQQEQARQLEQARIKQLTDNTIRWRDHDGVVESNARFVTWSDGSTSLQIGAEYFDVVTEALKEHHYMIDRHDHGLLESTNRFDEGVQFRPHSTTTQTHKRLSAAMSMQHRRGVKTKMVSTLSDPMALRRQAEKIQIEKEKADRRADRARRKLEDVYSEDEELGRPAVEATASRSFLPSKFLRQATERYDEEDSDEDYDAGDKAATDREGSSSPSEASEASRGKETRADGGTPLEPAALDTTAPPAAARRRQVIEDESDDE